jgi:hypothetical protein
MPWGKVAKIALAIAVYVALTVVIDGLVHWWALVASPVPDAVGVSIWLLFTVAYVRLAWRVLGKRA